MSLGDVIQLILPEVVGSGGGTRTPDTRNVIVLISLNRKHSHQGTGTN